MADDASAGFAKMNTYSFSTGFKRNCQTVLISLFLFIGLIGCKQKDNDSQSRSPAPAINHWKRFSSADGNFSVLFPGTPQEKRQTERTPIGEIELHCFIVEADRQTAYGVNYSDIPQSANLRDPQKFFDRSQALTAGEKGKILFQQEIKLGNSPGREFKFSKGGKSNYSGRVRLFLVGHRLYELVAIYLTINPHPVEREAFFNSFSLPPN